MSVNIHRYKVAHGWNISELTNQVEFYLDAGYKVQGGLCVDKDGYFSQAMIKEIN